MGELIAPEFKRNVVRHDGGCIWPLDIGGGEGGHGEGASLRKLISSARGKLFTICWPS